MDDTLLALAMLRVANFAAAGYLLYTMFSMRRATKDNLFSRALFILSIAIALYFIGDLISIFQLVPSEGFALFQAAFTFLFMVLLFYSITHLRRDMRAYEHLIHRKARRKPTYVD